MGWTFFHKPKNQSVKDTLAQEFDFDGGKVLDCAVVGMRTAYLAYQRGDEVSAIVCLLQYDNGSQQNFGYKDMSESMGPYNYDCPERILNLLTPTTDTTALAWRAACRTKHTSKHTAPKVKDGDKIKFDAPLRFGNGQTLDTFFVEKIGKKTRFRWNGGMYMIPKFQERKFTVL